ncbi:hypothetical protein [Spirulina major]|uniref:hypothetical protein n=1 Tax=Spirulina major TaxID=270636 RepID=UPI000934D745|nr:hypothetical protein [Spirulina major]
MHQPIAAAQSQRIEALLERSTPLTPQEQQEVVTLQTECDRAILCKAQAAAILRWRGHGLSIPQSV